MSGVLCYLAINKIPNLPRIAISSALVHTSSDIYIGYLNLDDLTDLPKDPRIHLVDLSDAATRRGLRDKSSKYVDFSQDYFFQLVQLKWDLFRLVGETSKADFVAYSDLDVVILKDVISEFNMLFQDTPHIEIAVQDFTYSIVEPRLCMGIFVFRNNKEAASIITECSEIHKNGLMENSRFGDDDVITRYFVDHGRSNRILLLPQQSFPVGNLVNLFLPFSPLRGLRPDFPYIYHANFVVGSRKKEFLLKLITARIQHDSPFKVPFLYLKLSAFQVNPLTKRILRKLRLLK
jgi:hypothetical protein